LVSVSLGIGGHVSGIADPFNGHIDAFRISHGQAPAGGASNVAAACSTGLAATC
jgi:hypothetical protein